MLIRAYQKHLVGNSDLQPEEVKIIDFSISRKLNRTNTEIMVSLYKNKFTDLIDLQETPTLQLVNRKNTITQGASLVVSSRFSKEITNSVNIDYLETNIEDSDENLRGRPKLRIGEKLHWQPSSIIQSYLYALYSDKVHDSSIPTGDRELDKYLRFDVGMEWKVGKHWRLSLKVDNFLDEEYETAVGFPAPGRVARIGLYAKF